jgi:hypothetical protein
MKWWCWLLLPITIPILLVLLVLFTIGSGVAVMKQALWPDSLG